MEKKSERLIKILIDQLTDIYDKTLNLFNDVHLVDRIEKDQSGNSVTYTTLSPNPKQQVISNNIYEDYQKWTKIVFSLVERYYSEEIRNQFSQTTDLFSTYILFQRVGTNISHNVWKDLFVRESQAIVNAQNRFLREFEDKLPGISSAVTYSYVPFTVKLRKKENSFIVEAESNFGEAENIINFPFNNTELENFVLKYCQPRHVPVRSWTPIHMRPIVGFGEQLFNTLLSGEVRDLYNRARQQAEVSGLGLRINLKLKNAPELSDIPWELMHDSRDFLCLSKQTPITRYLESNSSVRPLMVTPPFRILVTTSSPKNVTKLDIEAEKKKLEIALTPLIALGLLQIDFTPNGTLRSVQKMLRTAEAQNKPYHVWHYIGHGAYDEDAGNSVLLFEDDKGLGNLITGFELGTLFNSYPSIRLALLNACEGARSSKEDLLSAVALSLVDRGMPAVIAMQFEISDEAAIIFSEEFYGGLVDRLPIDAALTEARRAIFLIPNQIEWATPVLFMRSENGEIFDFQEKNIH